MAVLNDSPQAASASLGDPEGWIDDYGDYLLRFAAVRVGDSATAEDLVQETLLAAWRNRSTFDGACSPKTWLVAILKRRVADHFRRAGRQLSRATEKEIEEPVLAISDSGGAEQASEAAELWHIVTSCTSDLPEHLARAFRLRTFGDDAPDSICDAEGITRKNLSVRLHRARQMLRQCLEKRWFGNGGSATDAPTQ